MKTAVKKFEAAVAENDRAVAETAYRVAVKKVVGSPSQLRSWGQMESAKIDTVIWSNFKKSYETTQSRNREINSLPVGIRGLIQQTSTQMIGGA